MNKPTKYILLVVLFAVLAMIRYFENELFYDPYLTFFENDYLYIDNPRREVFKLTAYTTLRYVLNSVISLGILFVIFRDRNIIKFSTLIYAIAYVIFLALFLYFVLNPRKEDYYLFFNIRRFLIQPIILLLLLPAFYYHKLKQ
jgi:exosortase F-associated protein